MSALTVLVIRHAEKPEHGIAGPGLTEAGQENAKSLTVRGWQRSGAWAALFGASSGGSDYPRPSIIYCANPDAADTGNGGSRRPFETILPLAARLSLTPITRWAVGQEEELVKEIGRLTGTVLVCWEHKAIAKKIVPGLMKEQVLPGMPSKWDSARFDPVLWFNRALPDQPWSFRQLFPRLLAGDTDTPLPSGRQDDVAD